MLRRQLLQELMSHFTGFQTFLSLGDITLKVNSVEEQQVKVPENFIDLKLLDETGSKQGLQATTDKVANLKKNGAFLVNKRSKVPTGEYIIPNRFVYVQKRTGEKRARGVAGDHKQFDKLFGSNDGSSTAAFLDLKIFQIKTLKEKYFLFPINFETAYLNGILERSVYMIFPKGYDHIDRTKWLNGKRVSMVLKKPVEFGTSLGPGT